MRPDLEAIQKRLDNFNESRQRGYAWGSSGATDAMILFRDYAPADIATLLAYVRQMETPQIGNLTASSVLIAGDIKGDVNL